MQSGENILNFQNVSFGFNQQILVQDFNLKIKPKEFVAITGESGRGKTSLLKLALGLLQPTSGKIELFSQPIMPSNVANLRKKLFWLPQNVNLPIANLTDLLDFLQIRNREKFAEYLAKLQLDFAKLIKKDFNQLSLGEKQRVLLACGFASGKELLVLDEPSSALDDASINNLLELVSAIQVCIFSISHNNLWNQKAQKLVQI